MAGFLSESLDKGFEFRCVVTFFAKVDNVDGDIVLFHLFGQTNEVLRAVFDGRSDEDDNALFLKFILSVFES